MTSSDTDGENELPEAVEFDIEFRRLQCAQTEDEVLLFKFTLGLVMTVKTNRLI